MRSFAIRCGSASHRHGHRRPTAGYEPPPELLLPLELLPLELLLELLLLLESSLPELLPLEPPLPELPPLEREPLRQSPIRMFPSGECRYDDSKRTAGRGQKHPGVP
jgi:hypothetical protein